VRAIDVRLLGPIEVSVAGSGIALRPQLRRLLALLTVSCRTPVTVSALVEGLWDDASRPREPEATLFTHVAKLRATLRDRDHSLIRRAQGAYWLDVDPLDVDAGRFESHLTAGRAHARSDRHTSAIERLRAALAEWRGPAFGDVRSTEFAFVEASRLEEQRAAAAEELGQSLLAEGYAADATELLHSYTAAYPFRESLWLVYLRSLVVQGRVAEARIRYAELGRVLRRELGVNPSPPLGAVFDALGTAGCHALVAARS
jgi:DNA-binding SARP family transcriptional activator